MRKKCSKCETEKDLNDFHKVGNRKNSYCKVCAIRIAKDWYTLHKDEPSVRNRNRAAWRKSRDDFQQLINDIKSQIGCIHCGEKTAACLDFHHFGDKSYAISYLTATKSVIKTSEELKKCVCICANCHRKLHAGLVEIVDYSGIVVSEDTLTEMLKNINPSFKSGRRKRRTNKDLLSWQNGYAPDS